MRRSYRDVREEKARRKKRGLLIAAAVLAAAAVLCIAAAKLLQESSPEVPDAALLRDFDGKYADLLDAFTRDADAGLAYRPAGDAGYAVFLSVSDGTERAAVFTGTGDSAQDAWEDARTQCREYVSDRRCEARWLRADVVTGTVSVTRSELAELLRDSVSGFFRRGLALDSGFGVALTEAELNGAKIYDYDDCEVDIDYLNGYLKEAGRPQVLSVPGDLILFECRAWFADGDGAIYELQDSGTGCGARDVGTIDADLALDMISSAAQYLSTQVNADGSFVYGRYPRFDRVMSGYNALRHAGTVWSLIYQYRLTGDADAIPLIDSTMEYMLANYVVYADGGTAYFRDPDADEIKLGGSGIAILALTEYMDVFGTDKYADTARALGNGILTMLDTSTGEYTHVLNPDFTVKEEYRTVYYDGEATFALCRLYGMDQDGKWLAAACSAVDHFIAADYTQYRDHWVSYTMNEITKYVPSEEYYTFALKNIQINLDYFINCDTMYNVLLEMIMAGFETYDRMLGQDIHPEYLEEFDEELFLRAIYRRAERVVDGYFFPETAMYMEVPDSVLGSFMVRNDGFRVRIDDVQHCTGGLYLFYRNYDRLVEYGLLSNIN